MSHASELIRKCCSNARNLAKVAKSPWQQLHRERERKRERERERERDGRYMAKAPQKAWKVTEQLFREFCEKDVPS